MKVKRGTTLMEFMIVMLVMSLIIGIAAKLTISTMSKFDETSQKARNPIKEIRAVEVISNAIAGCDEVKVENNILKIMDRGNKLEINKESFSELDVLDFELVNDKLNVKIGSDSFCLQVLKNE